MALTEREQLLWTIEEFCDEHASSKADGNADYVLDVGTFHNWCDANGYDYKEDVPDNKTLRELIAESAFAEQCDDVPN